MSRDLRHGDDDGNLFGEEYSQCSYVIIFNDTSFISFISGLMQIGCVIYVFIFLRNSEKAARNGQPTKVIVLPVYKSLINYNTFFAILIGIFRLAGLFENSVLYISIKWMIYRFLTEAMAVFLMHNGVGRRAVQDSAIISLCWTLFSGIIPLVFYVTYGFDTFCTCSIVVNGLLGVFYLCNWLLPASMLHRRPSMISFARFYSCVFLMLFVSMFFVKYNSDPSGCTVNVLTAIGDFVQPLLLFRAIVNDSLFWQGIVQYHRSGSYVIKLYYTL